MEHGQYRITGFSVGYINFGIILIWYRLGQRFKMTECPNCGQENYGSPPGPLELERDALKERDATRDAAYKVVYAEYERLKAEAERLTKMLESERKESHRSQVSYATLLGEAEAELAAVRKAETEWHRDEERLREDLTAERDALKRSVKIWMGERNRLDDENDALKAELRTELDRRERLRQDNAALKARVAELEAELARLNRYPSLLLAIGRLEAERDALIVERDNIMFESSEKLNALKARAEFPEFRLDVMIKSEKRLSKDLQLEGGGRESGDSLQGPQGDGQDPEGKSPAANPAAHIIRRRKLDASGPMSKGEICSCGKAPHGGGREK